MKVPYDEGIASHIGPESCAGGRKGAGEALTGESAGRVLSRERRFCFGVPTVSIIMEGNTGCPDKEARDTLAPRGRRPRARTEAFCTGTGRSHNLPWEMAPGDAP
jgi:hypothetical protein